MDLKRLVSLKVEPAKAKKGGWSTRSPKTFQKAPWIVNIWTNSYVGVGFDHSLILQSEGKVTPYPSLAK
jgi:hypothetical protein